MDQGYSSSPLHHLFSMQGSNLKHAEKFKYYLEK